MICSRGSVRTTLDGSDLDAVAAVGLGPIEPRVRHSQQVLGILAVGREPGDARAEGDAEALALLALELHAGQLRRGASQDLPGALGRLARQRHDELLTAPSAAHVLAAEARGEQP